MPMNTLYTDGACDPNPGGRLGWGYVLTVDGVERTDSGAYAPAPGNTNNVAEYIALIAGLRAAVAGPVHGLHVQSDSQLVVNQVNGIWGVRDPVLAGHQRTVRELLSPLPGVIIRWVPRNENTMADRLAAGVSVADGLAVPVLTFAPGCATATAQISAAVRRQIDGLNTTAAPSFGAFAALQVGGSDAYSAESLVLLRSVLPPAIVAQVQAAVPDATACAATLRWIRRGLAVEYALRKAAVDAEIRSRSRSVRR